MGKSYNVHYVIDSDDDVQYAGSGGGHSIYLPWKRVLSVRLQCDSTSAHNNMSLLSAQSVAGYVQCYDSTSLEYALQFEGLLPPSTIASYSYNNNNIRLGRISQLGT